MMNKLTSQIRPFLGVLKVSLLSTLRTPASIVFGFLFPLVFILVFGFLGNNSGAYELVVDKESNTDNPIYKALEEVESIKLVTDKDQKQIDEDLSKGNTDGGINIKVEQTDKGSKYNVQLTTTSASPQAGSVIVSIVSNIGDKINLSTVNVQQLPVIVSSNEVSGRKFKTIDFILPGQLGFSLLSSGIFATAFVFIALKQTLVLKRFFTTPVSKGSVILAEGTSRLIFAVFQSSFIILVGYLFFDYTLVHGFLTFIQMIALSMIGLIVFLGLGFIVSSVAKDENTAAPLAQIFTLPQFLLAGTFFPVEQFPTWLQPVSRVMPLYFLNTAMRKVAFEGSNMIDVLPQIGWLLLSGVVIYAVAIRIFKWE